MHGQGDDIPCQMTCPMSTLVWGCKAATPLDHHHLHMMIATEMASSVVEVDAHRSSSSPHNSAVLSCSAFAGDFPALSEQAECEEVHFLRRDGRLTDNLWKWCIFF